MYIKFVFDQNKNFYVYYWLLLITFLVALMIIIGGLTRLTDSGLSITKWDLIVGILPPLSKEKWKIAFSLYMKIPEFKLLNSSMTLEEFKYIYWWEYLHRLLGRLVGLLYIVPLIFFSLKNYIEKKSLYFFYFIFLLIVLQGIIGWYMVKSGLTERTYVSHYRLSLHLTLAFVIYILLFWNCLSYSKINRPVKNNIIPYFLIHFFILLVILQISLGALVSGLDAGQIYNSWPLMDENFFPDDSNIKDLFSFKLFETPSLVQFLHRNLAYFILFFFSTLAYIIFSNKKFVYLRKTTVIISFILIIQVFFGILTVLSGAHILLASMHQISSILLVSMSITLLYKNLRSN